MFFLEDTKEDRLKVEIIIPLFISTIATSSNYIEGLRLKATIVIRKKRVKEKEE